MTKTRQGKTIEGKNTPKQDKTRENKTIED